MINDIILAGLVHDIGKFMQRAYKGLDNLSSQSKNMDASLCPEKDGRYSHLHVLFTNEFCENFLSNLPSSIDKLSVTNLACYHHKPSDEQQKIIQEADWLSSGMERYDDDSFGGSRKFRKIRLRSIMSQINIGKGSDESIWDHKLEPLKPSNVFPVKHNGEHSSNVDLTDEYYNLWNKFLTDWEQNEVKDSWGFINRALSMIEYYTWCIPSATNVLPDISLFDHSKTTAAIAACLSISPDDRSPFLFVAGDFTGIQKFIFDIKKGHGGYAKRLRAKSFFVSLMSESVSVKILKAVDLPLTQRIMFAGGKFHLLLPNTPEVTEQVTKLKLEIDTWLWEKTGGDIRFSLIFQVSDKDGLMNFSDTVTQINQLLRSEKDKPYKSILQDAGKWNTHLFLGDEIHKSDTEKVCDICEKHPGKRKLKDGDEVYICDLCAYDLTLGTILPKAKYVSFYDYSIGHEIIPGIFVEVSKEYPEQSQERPIMVKNISGEINAPPEVPFVTANAISYIPFCGDKPMDFDVIMEQSQGQEQLAYLKGDIDNLGYVFKDGFRKSNNDTDNLTSISRIATLSRTLEQFFTGYFESLLKHHEKYQYIYTVYSGGDDFLCLGPWDIMIDFARELREKFALYTCENPNWTLSMGLILAGKHMPVLEAVELADKYLEASKNIHGNETVPVEGNLKENALPHKNRITLFGTSFPCESFDTAFKRALKIYEWISAEDNTLSSAQIWRLRQYGEIYRKWTLSKDTRYLEYIPLLAYDIRRNWNWKSREMTPSRQEALEWVRKLINKPDVEDMKLLKFACEYALIANR